MGRSVRRLTRKTLARIAALAICVQFLVPTGYMPGAWANGSPFVFCGSHSSELANDQSHTAHREHATSNDTTDHAPSEHQHSDSVGGDAWEYCPLGAAASDAAFTFSFGFTTDRIENDLFTLALLPQCGKTVLQDLNCRAPPRHRTRH